MKIRFIVNPIAGPREKIEDINRGVSRIFSSARGIFEVRATRFSGEGFTLSREAVDLGYETVFACGGDGTINQVASALVNSKTVLGILPIGSGNALARALKIPFNIEEALALPLRGKIREIDVGNTSGRFFFSTAGLGLDAVISKKYAERANANSKRGILPYLPLTILGYFSYTVESMLVKYDDKYLRTSPLFLTIANTGQYGARAIIAPEAKIDDGLFDVCIVEDMGFFKMIGFTLKLFRGKVNTLKNYKTVRASRVEIVKKTSGIVQIDGEPFDCSKNITFDILPRALRVWTISQKYGVKS